PFKADLWMTLTFNRSEVPALIDALKTGRIDGSQYEGECSCLKGTIATAKKVDYRTLAPNSSDPAECWFMNIKEGDTPETNLSSQLAVEWIEEWCALNSVEVKP
ncbi:MAG: hypothetical protein ABL936_19105, partial [Aestuariivirga sp.]